MKKLKGKIEKAIVKIVKKHGLNDYLDQRFNPNLVCNEFSERALEVAENIRGKSRKPGLFIHGVLPRSGTVYTGELIRLYPDIFAFPNNMWEIPLLKTSGHILNAQREFLNTYELNRERMGEHDFLPLFGSAVLAYLHSFVPEGKIMLTKVPSVQFINLFFSMFPSENLILLLRDGRDVVNSTVKSWPEMDFEEVCHQWKGSANLMLEFEKKFAHMKNRFWLTKYEYSVNEPEAFIRELCANFRLDEKKYPFEKIKDIKIHGSSTVKKKKKVTWDPVEKPEHFKPIGKWSTWSEEQKEKFKKIAGQLLIQTGYADDNSW